MNNPIHIWRVPRMIFGPRELASGLEAMTPEMLSKIRQAGFTGVWVMVRLRDVVRTSVFPELGAEAPRNQEILQELGGRCQAAGLKLYLYLNEPRGFAEDDPFWQSHPELRGARSFSPPDQYLYGWLNSCAMCTSGGNTLRYLEEACAGVFRRLPQLGGIICITQSEHTTHCYSHFDSCRTGIGAHFGQKPGDVLDCPRCRHRQPVEIVRDVLVAIERGVHSASPSADVVAWTWSWDMLAPPPQDQLIASLPGEIIIMPDNERGGELEWNGHKLKVDEYSLNYIGPSPRAAGQIEAARRSGKRSMIRLQINHTIECATAPNWPLIANLYRKLANLRRQGVHDAMASWTFDNNPETLNVFAYRMFSRRTQWRDEDEFLECVAREYFELADGPSVAAAWRAFGKAVEPYPFGFGILYFSPFNLACAFPLPNHEPRTRPMKFWNFLEDGRQGDMLEQSVEPFGLGGAVERLQLVHQSWQKAVDQYQCALAGAGHGVHAEQELSVARYFGHLVHSAWVLFSWVAWRYHPGAIPALDKATMVARLKSELQNLDSAARLLERDPRLGFYEKDQKYYVTPALVRAKRTSDEQVLKTLDGRCELSGNRG